MGPAGQVQLFAGGRRAMTLLPHPTVRLVICGNADRGDDGAALAAAATLLPTLSRDLGARLEIRRRPELHVEDLVDLRPDERCLIVDAVSGVAPGEIVVTPLAALFEDPGFTPRSSHELPLDRVLALAAIIREQPIDGSFVGIGGHRFGYGTPLSRHARAALPGFRDAITRELIRLAAPQSRAGPGMTL
ncbi:MAG: hydrogenase maturation protease [Chloroflexota bacterium]